MGMMWNNAAFNHFQARFTNLDARILDQAEPLVEEALQEGARVQQAVIATSGTGYKDRQGRVETGSMLDDVDTSPVRRSGSTVEGEFGWVDRRKDYYAYQEQGFTHYLSGKDVAPMHALFSGFVTARETVRAGIRAILGRL